MYKTVQKEKYGDFCWLAQKEINLVTKENA
jgi:hypothetical protein